MNVLWFLKERTAFIRRHYQMAATPFREIVRKINDEEEPYEPPFTEDEEPPFISEWDEANTSLEILGATCVSMLSEALKLYFKAWEGQLGLECASRFPSDFSQRKGNGFLHGYKTCFGEFLETDWADCPVDFELVEQIILARNDAQHPDLLTNLQPRLGKQVQAKYSLPFFVSEHERTLIESGQPMPYPWFSPKLSVSQEALFEACNQVELLAEWIEVRLLDVVYGKN